MQHNYFFDIKTNTLKSSKKDDYIEFAMEGMV